MNAAAATRRVLLRGSCLRLSASPVLSSAVRSTAVRSSAVPTRTLAVKSASPPPFAPPKACPDDQIPSILEQATGLERAEIEYPDLFRHNEVLRGPFGTEDNPVKIQSAFDNRIVGCTGRESPNDHDIMWIMVEKGKKACCSECDQYFTLDPL